MKRSSISRRSSLTACAVAGLAGLLLFTSLAGNVEAYGCRSVARVKLVPTDPTAVPKLRARAALLSCADGSALVDVRVKQKVADGTAFIAALPGIEPVMGEWFYIARRKAEGFINIASAGQARGRMIGIYDQDFNELAIGVIP